jgi:hypothetical protein
VEAVGQAMVGVADEVIDDDRIEDERGEDVARQDDECGHGRDADGMPAVRSGEVHASTNR